MFYISLLGMLSFCGPKNDVVRRCLDTFALCTTKLQQEAPWHIAKAYCSIPVPCLLKGFEIFQVPPRIYDNVSNINANSTGVYREARFPLACTKKHNFRCGAASKKDVPVAGLVCLVWGVQNCEYPQCRFWKIAVGKADFGNGC